MRALLRRGRPAAAHVALLGVGLLFLFPFYWLVSTALKADGEIFRTPPVWLPASPRWDNFAKAVSAIPFLAYTLNTVRVSALTVLGTVLSSSAVAYSLAKIPWRGRGLVFGSLVATMLLPSQVTMLPTFMTFKWLGWIGTILPLTAPAFCGSAFNVFLLRQFFLTLPNELSDAARIDGCGEFGIFARIVLPLSKPALATVALFTFIASWNDFLGPLLYLNDERTYTLSIGLQRFVSQHDAEWGPLMAAATLMLVPIVVVFFLAQRTFIQGVVTTGSKE